MNKPDASRTEPCPICERPMRIVFEEPANQYMWFCKPCNYGRFDAALLPENEEILKRFPPAKE
jgi:hypothetical protein